MNNEMRTYIYLAESLGMSDEELETAVEADIDNDEFETLDLLVEDLILLVEKLRAHSEPEDGDFSLGVEMGMNRAADMIENAIKRHGSEME